MSQAFDGIMKDVSAFRLRVGNYEDVINKLNLCKDACESAYESLYKLKERIDKELENIDKTDITNIEEQCCRNIFQDNFLKGLLDLRTVATHIQNDQALRNGTFSILSPEGATIELSPSASAIAVFSHNIFVLENQRFGADSINHLNNLREAERRIVKKLDEACTDMVLKTKR